MRKFRFILGSLVITLIYMLLTSCTASLDVEQSPETAPPASPPVTAPENTQLPSDDTAPSPVSDVSISYEITGNPESRWQDITLSVTDENGNPVPDIVVDYEEKDIDFFFDAAYCPDKAWAPVVDGEWDFSWESRASDAEEREAEYAAVGFNTDLAYLGLWWKDAEPEYDNNWQNVGGPFGYWEEKGWSYREDPSLPGTRFFRVNLGPSFSPGIGGAENPGSLDPSQWVPNWIDYENEKEFKTQYAEYIEKIIDVANITIGSGYDLYEIGVEINDWWNLPWQDRPTSWPIPESTWIEWVNLIKWEADLVKSLDPDARICINFDHMGWSPEYTVHLGPQPLIEEMIKQEVPFDVIGFEIHPGSFLFEYDTVEFWRDFLDEMEQYGKYIYIWEYAVKDHGKPEPAPDWAPTWEPPVSEYTEEYQNEVFMRIFEMFIEDPRVIGVALLDYCDSPPDIEQREVNEEGSSMGAGLLRWDKTTKPLYHTLKDYWHSLMVSGSMATNQDGEISFNAIPGLFEVTVNGQAEVIRITE